MTAVQLFRSHWFSRNEPSLDLTTVEQEVIRAALGDAPKRWEGQGDQDSLKKIVDTHPDVLARIGERLLKVAISMRGCGETTKVLLDRGVKLDADPTEYNVLHEAAWAGATVFESGAADATHVSVLKPHTGWPDNLSLMYWAAWGGYVDMAKLLINHGVGAHHELKIKGNGERGSTSLHEAVAPSPWLANDQLHTASGKLGVAQLLIDDGAEYDIYTACARNDVDRVTHLIASIPNVVELADAFNMTPLHWAARAGASECVTVLLDGGAAADYVNNNGRAAIQLVAEQNNGEMIEQLASAGAHLNTQDKKGRTPLHRATYEGSVAAAEALLRAGADASILNKKGKSAFEIARKEAKFYKRRA